MVSCAIVATAVQNDRMVILGSGGARIVVAKQLRASGGIWFSLGGTRFLLDPGPGALVRMTGSRHRLDPTRLTGILLSHRHLDHSGDVNNMIEAMTMGGTEPRGALFAPSDALEGDDPVVLKYVRPFLKQVVTLKEGGSYEIGSFRFTCPVRHQHRGEVYGFRFEVPGLSVSYIADTRYFPKLAEHYRADVVIMNVVRLLPSDLDHLHVPDAEELVKAIRPRLAVLSHFGMKMLAARPWVIAREMSERTGCQVVAASDGMLIDLEQYKATNPRPQTLNPKPEGAE
jgi:phosphoribosyl 1,2-cyclic phosphodiesterase